VSSIVCIQETKLQFCDDFICASLWGAPSHSFSFYPSVGASGGLLTMWDSNEVEVWDSAGGNNYLMIHGNFVKSNEEFYLFNVYAPCDMLAKQALWDCLSNRLAQLVDKKVCICGDFNVVRNGEERRSIRNSVIEVDYVSFNGFIDDNLLVDLPLHGRKYTWFKGDGKWMSRLDRFLLLEEWCLEWPNCIQVALLRGLSDHCPLVMSIDEENWGPRPTHLLKCWQDTPGYKLFVSDKWKSFQISGWGGYVLKEKFKLIKMALKEWHVSHTLNLSAKITALKERQDTIDGKGEDETLTNEELLELHDISLNIHSLSILNTSICWQ